MSRHEDRDKQQQLGEILARQNQHSEMLEKLSELVSEVAVLKAQREVNAWVKLAVGTVVAGMVMWLTWVTVNVANYVSGGPRGERLTNIEAELMIARALKKNEAEVEHLIDQRLKQLKP